MGSTSPLCPPFGRSPRSGVGRHRQPERLCSLCATESCTAPERRCATNVSTCAPIRSVGHSRVLVHSQSFEAEEAKASNEFSREEAQSIERNFC